jgi:hypothetical protein
MTLRLSENQYAALLKAQTPLAAAVLAPLAVHSPLGVRPPLAVHSPLALTASKAGRASPHAAPVSFLTVLRTVSAEVLIIVISTAAIGWVVFPLATAFILIAVAAIWLISPRAMRLLLGILAGIGAVLAVLGGLAVASNAAGLAAATLILLRFSHH